MPWVLSATSRSLRVLLGSSSLEGTNGIDWLDPWREDQAFSRDKESEQLYLPLEKMKRSLLAFQESRRPHAVFQLTSPRPRVAAATPNTNHASEECKKCPHHQHLNKKCWKQHPEMAPNRPKTKRNQFTSRNIEALEVYSTAAVSSTHDPDSTSIL